MGEATADTAQPLARRQRVGECLALRVTDIAPHRSFRQGFRAAGELCRPASAPGEVPETIAWEVRVEASASAWARFMHHRLGVGEVATYSVAVEAVDWPVGGIVWRWRCADGFGLVKALHLPPGAGRFASRRFYGLAYGSSSLSKPARAATQALAIRAALGGAADLGAPLPPRPRLMRRATYERHRREIEALTGEARGRGIRGGSVALAAMTL